MLRAVTEPAPTPSEWADERFVFERGLGDEAVRALKDPRVLDLAINPDGHAFAKVAGGGRVDVGRVCPVGVATAVQTVAHVCRREFGEAKPRLTARLPWSGSRFTAHLQPRFDGGPAVSIRNHGALNRSLDDYVRDGILDRQQHRQLLEAVGQRRNVLFVGETGAGKTTLCNAFAKEVGRRLPEERLYLIEEVSEMKVESRDVVAVECEKPEFRAEVELALRMNPGRIIVGEVRGDEALELVLAWATGHAGGCATVHAGTAAGGVRRLAVLAELALGRAVPPELVADAVDVAVRVSERADGTRRVEEVCEVRWDEEASRLRVLPAKGALQ